MTKEAKYFKPCSICHNDECVWIGTKDTHLICEDYKSQDGDCINKQAVLDIDFNRICVTTAKPAEMIRNKINNLPSVHPKSKTEWIPVSSKLPEEDGDYLAYIINPNDERFQYSMTCYYSTKANDWFPDDETASNNVVAWMLLPKPYKESEAQDANTNE